MLLRFVRRVGAIVVVVLITAVVGLAALLVVVPAASGGAALIVWTGSMEPNIPRGSVVVVRPVNPFQLSPGDVITHQVRPNEPTFVTHRIVEVNADAETPSVVTKGDANPSIDPDPVEMQWIRGKVLMHVPHVGLISEKVRTPSGITALLLFIGGSAIVMLTRNVVTELRKGRDENQPQEAETDKSASDAEQSSQGAVVSDVESDLVETPDMAHEEQAPRPSCAAEALGSRGTGASDVASGEDASRRQREHHTNESVDSATGGTEQISGQALVEVARGQDSSGRWHDPAPSDQRGRQADDRPGSFSKYTMRSR
jgi:signal peptidase I